MPLMDELYLCPFCAYKGRIVDFGFVRRGGGYSHKTFECPDCHNRMREKTLKRNMTIEQWAEWMYLSIRTFSKMSSPFYGRIVWLKLFKNLNILGFEVTTRFWNAWREIKASYYDLDENVIHEKINAGTNISDAVVSPITQWVFSNCPICNANVNSINIMKVYNEFESKEIIDGCLKCWVLDREKWRNAYIRKRVD